MRNLIRYAAAASVVALGLVACEKQLATKNEVSGNTEQVIGTPNDAEALISTYYKRWSSGVYGSTTDLEGMANVQSLMNFSSLANNCQNARYPFTNAANSNAPGNVCAGEQYRLYAILGEVDRVASNLLGQMDAGLNLGSSNPATDARNLRARSWAEFLRGLSIGYVALMYDSGAVVSPGMAGTDPGTLVPYTVMRDSALAAFQRAIDYAVPAATITGSGGFPLPTSWLPTPTAASASDFVKIIKSYRARIRANMARTPAERAAVDWTSVIADVQGGITADHLITTSTTAGPGNAWRQQYDAFSTWHQMPGFIIGMADVSGSYAAWLAQPVGDRGSGNNGFFMVTPDQRFPQGATRSAQNNDFTLSSCAGVTQPCKRYFVNRVSGNDAFSGPGWGWSDYDFARFHSWVTKGDGTARNGVTPFMTLSEMNLLRAEGEYYKGNYATACGLVNISRVNGSGGLFDLGGGLPPLTGGAGCDATSAVPGTSGPAGTCVPKAPIGPGNSLVCGTLWEALKYEKRIETAYTSFVPWFLDERGWGDLPEATPLFWAVPYQDLQARNRPISAIYGAGPGTGNAPNSTAAKGTYGW